MTSPDAVLVLENGEVFAGRAFGSISEGRGEVVFNTSLTGYQEVVSDPSYAGQIVVMTAPQIGNVGANAFDDEASAPACSGLVVRALSRITSNWRSEVSLPEYLERHGVIGLEGVDTRALTRMIRDQGAMRGVISTAVDRVDALVQSLASDAPMAGRNLVPRVTCSEPYAWLDGPWQAPGAPDAPATEDRYHVVAYDFGIKRGILRELRRHGLRITVVPAMTTVEEVRKLEADAVFFSNGPGDPAADVELVDNVSSVLGLELPTMGICLGCQLLGIALGAKTFKLPFGHHGGNHPVLDLETGRVEITSQNHGFAIAPDSMPNDVAVTHRNLNDQTVEGIRAQERPFFGIQYHPEASPGPHDARALFGRFADIIAQTGR